MRQDACPLYVGAAVRACAGLVPLAAPTPTAGNSPLARAEAILLFVRQVKEAGEARNELRLANARAA